MRHIKSIYNKSVVLITEPTSEFSCDTDGDCTGSAPLGEISSDSSMAANTLSGAGTRAMGSSSVPNWAVITNAYANLGPVAVNDSWSSSLLTSNRNMAIKKVYTQPCTSPSETGYKTSVVYYNGLGMPKQKVDVKASIDTKDLVTPYDESVLQVGEIYSYFPYISAKNNNGSFREAAIAEQASCNGAKAYVRQKFETSARGLLQEETRRGLDPAVSTKFETAVMGLTEGVKDIYYIPSEDKFYVRNTYSSPLPYRMPALVKTVATDEDGFVTEVFKNEIGNTILSRRRKAGDTTPLADTYYVYDKYQRLICVVSPEGEQLMPLGSSFTVDSDVARQYCFMYHYDDFGRIVEKKIPGREWEYFVYDKNNFLVFSQDGNQRAANSWCCCEYDVLGRLIRKSMKTGQSIGRQTIQDKVDAGDEITMLADKTLMECRYDQKLQYDQQRVMFATDFFRIGLFNKDFPWSMALKVDPDGVFFNEDNTIKDEYFCGTFKDPSGDTFNLYRVPQDYRSITDALNKYSPLFCQYTTQGPGSLILALSALVNTRWTKLYSDVDPALSFKAVDGVCTLNDVDRRTRGFKTYERVAVLDSSPERFVERCSYFNSAGRPMQIVEKNFTGDISRYSMKYDFTGNVLVHVEQHRTPGANTVDTKKTVYTYDSQGRVILEQVSLNDISGDSEYVYDPFGRLCDTYLSGSDGNNSYSGFLYNQRGQLERVGFSSLFDQSIIYGNAENIIYSHNNSINMKHLRVKNYYYYDDLKRLKSVDRSSDAVPTAHYTMSYDRNGNITSFVRDKGSEDYNSFTQTSTYCGNQLTQVVRSGADVVKNPDIKNGTFTFDYDDNGNMVYNSDKGWKLDYNHLNLLKRITSSAKGYSADYIYLSDGTKVKSVCSGSVTGSKIYLGSLIYDIGAQEKSTSFTGGRLVDSYASDTNSDCTLLHVCDHLGSVRVIRKHGKSVALNEYESFGLLDRDYCIHETEASGVFPDKDNKFLFNGKEDVSPDLADMLLDYGARVYDPLLGVWTSPDPLAEGHCSSSPYCFCGNDPVNRIDPDGCDWYQFDNPSGRETAFWRDSTARYLTVNGQEFKNIGSMYRADYFWGSVLYDQNIPLVFIYKREDSEGGAYGFGFGFGENSLAYDPGDFGSMKGDGSYKPPHLSDNALAGLNAVNYVISGVDYATNMVDYKLAKVFTKQPWLKTSLQTLKVLGGILNATLAINQLTKWSDLNVGEKVSAIGSLLAPLSPGFIILIVAGEFSNWATPYVMQIVNGFDNKVRSDIMWGLSY